MNVYKGTLNFPAPMGGCLTVAPDRRMSKELRLDEDTDVELPTETDDAVRSIPFRVVCGGRPLMTEHGNGPHSLIVSFPDSTDRYDYYVRDYVDKKNLRKCLWNPREFRRYAEYHKLPFRKYPGPQE